MKLDEILATYRDTFGVKSERSNQIHRLACEEVDYLRTALDEARKVMEKYAEYKHSVWLNTNPQWAVDWLNKYPAPEKSK